MMLLYEEKPLKSWRLFIAKMRNITLHSGAKLSVALGPKPSREQCNSKTKEMNEQFPRIKRNENETKKRAMKKSVKRMIKGTRKAMPHRK